MVHSIVGNVVVDILDLGVRVYLLGKILENFVDNFYRVGTAAILEEGGVNFRQVIESIDLFPEVLNIFLCLASERFELSSEIILCFSQLLSYFRDELFYHKVHMIFDFIKIYFHPAVLAQEAQHFRVE